MTDAVQTELIVTVARPISEGPLDLALAVEVARRDVPWALDVRVANPVSNTHSAPADEREVRLELTEILEDLCSQPMPTVASRLEALAQRIRTHHVQLLLDETVSQSQETTHG